MKCCTVKFVEGVSEILYHEFMAMFGALRASVYVWDESPGVIKPVDKKFNSELPVNNTQQSKTGSEDSAEIASALNEIEHGLNEPLDVRCIKNGISRIRRLLPLQ